MDFLETSMNWAMALNYLRERARERKSQPDEPSRMESLRLSIQIVGRALMALGLSIQLAGKQLILSSQK
jgi:hypothetical protein